MNAAISIDDELLREADRTARRMGLNRSQFFARAVRDFLRQHREEQMLRQLNEVYTGGMRPAEKRLLKSVKAKARATVKERW